MNQNYLPPLLRGIGMTMVLFAAVFSVMVARSHVRLERINREAVHAKAEADAEAQPLEVRNVAELKAEVDDLRARIQEESVGEEVIENPLFNWISLLGTAVMVSSFYLEAFQRKHEASGS